MKHLFARLLLALTVGIFFSTEAAAQDPQYSQFYANQLLLNPAFAGAGTGPRVAMNYRAQWVRIPGFYKQFSFSYDQPVYFLGSRQGLGINFNSDQAGEGDLTKLNVSINYAYQVEITDDNFLRFGLAGGIQQASLDFFKLRFPDQIDPRDGFVRPSNEPVPNQSVIRPDVSAGLAYFNEYAWIGATVNHITEPIETFTDFAGQDAKLPRKFTVTGGIRIPISEGRGRNARDVSITPVFLYKMQGNFFQIDGGLYLNADPMVFGVWYRHQDAMIGLIGVRQGPFSFGYSYDYTISDLTQSISGGSHEVSVVLEFESDPPSRKLRHRRLPCPRF